MQDLGTLGGAYGYTYGNRINASVQVVVLTSISAPPVPFGPRPMVCRRLAVMGRQCAHTESTTVDESWRLPQSIKFNCLYWPTINDRGHIIAQDNTHGMFPWRSTRGFTSLPTGFVPCLFNHQDVIVGTGLGRNARGWPREH